MKSRLALLEKTMQQLRKSSPEQTARLVEELKQTPDEFWAPMAAIDEDEGTPPTTATSPDGNASTNTTKTPTLQHASSSNSLENTSTTSQSQTTAASSRNNSGGGQSTSGQGQQEQHLIDSMEVEETASPLRERASVSTEPSLLSPTPWQLWDHNGNTSLGPAIILPIPDLETINAAINEYFIRIDRLFQPFSREELKTLHRIASGVSSSTASTEVDRKQQQQIALSCLTAVASLGSQCLIDAQSYTRVAEQEAFTNIARHYLDMVIEHEPLDAVRVCALLAGTVIMNKPGLALSYVGVFLFPLIPFPRLCIFYPFPPFPALFFFSLINFLLSFEKPGIQFSGFELEVGKKWKERWNFPHLSKPCHARSTPHRFPIQKLIEMDP